MNYLLDTNACIAILNGSSAILRDRLNEIGPQNIVLCSVVKGELFYGARKSAHVEKNISRVAEFCKGLKSVAYDDRAAEFYGVHRAILERAGTTIGEADLMISCIALVHDLTVVTKNQREFARIPGLRIEDW